MLSRQQPVSKFKHDIYSGLRTFWFVFSYLLFNDVLLLILYRVPKMSLYIMGNMLKIESQLAFAPPCTAWSRRKINILKWIWTPIFVT